MSEWKECLIDDLKAKGKTAISIGPFGSRMKSDCYQSLGVPVIRGNNISDTPAFIDNFVYISEEKADELESSKVYENDLVFPHRGNIGEVGIITNGKYKTYILSSSLMKLTCDYKLVSANFIYYYFKSRIGKGKLLQNASQVGTPGIATPLTSLKQISIKLPPLEEQKRIADILSCLDSKIENLRRQNETLEKIAQTLFKHWFIDFEFPFDFAQDKPNADGKPYKSSGGVMVPSELGDIPEGWRVGTLGDVGKNIRNGIKETEITSDMFYIALEHIPRKQISLDTWEKALDIASNKFSFSKGQILFGKLRPYFHKVGVSFISGVCSTDILVLDSKKKDYFGYFLMIVSSEDFIRYVTLASEGTRMPRTNWDYMKDYKILLPDDSITQSFNEILNVFIQKMEVNVYQIQTLTKVRDSLLPKLMSGQILVKE